MPVYKLKSYGEGTFSIADPTLLNRLPEEVRNKPLLECFKSLLKTHLFKVTFSNKIIINYLQTKFISIP